VFGDIPLNELLDIIAGIFIVLFVVIEPVGLVPLFSSLTRDLDPAAQRRTAVKGTLISAVILVGFIFAGDTLLNYLNVSVHSFSIAGGILLFLLAIEMVFARQSGLRSTTPSENVEARDKLDVSVFPLAIPLIAGPGALTSLLLLSSRYDHVPHIVWLVVLVLLVVLLILLILLLSTPVVSRLLGETGSNVISRVLGIVLAALAVQFVLDGISGGLGFQAP